MTPSPDRDPRFLNHPDLKITEGMLVAFDAAINLEECAGPQLAARIIDADTLLDPPRYPMRVHANAVEVLIDPTGVLVIATGWDVLRPVYVAPLPLPRPGVDVSETIFSMALGQCAGEAMAELGRQTRAPWPPKRSGYL
jgi:hypothetical protein